MNTIRWFGDRRWDAPVCDLPRVEVPVRSSCRRCGKPILAGDQGLIVPAIGEEAAPSVYHRLCLLAELGLTS